MADETISEIFEVSNIRWPGPTAAYAMHHAAKIENCKKEVQEIIDRAISGDVAALRGSVQICQMFEQLNKALGDHQAAGGGR